MMFFDVVLSCPLHVIFSVTVNVPLFGKLKVGFSNCDSVVPEFQ